MTISCLPLPLLWGEEKDEDKKIPLRHRLNRLLGKNNEQSLTESVTAGYSSIENYIQIAGVTTASTADIYNSGLYASPPEQNLNATNEDFWAAVASSGAVIIATATALDSMASSLQSAYKIRSGIQVSSRSELDFTKQTSDSRVYWRSIEMIRDDIVILLNEYTYDSFEYGPDSQFRENIESYIELYEDRAVKAIADIISKKLATPTVVSEVLHQLGRLKHPETHPSRLILLERNLSSSSRWIRDGAALGLASMKDSRAIPYLRDAIAKEEILDLRVDLEAVLSRLESI